MRKSSLLILLFLLAAHFAFAQKSNEAIAEQIRSLKAEKSIELSYDEASGTSKIMARAENFDAKDASKAGVQAMNFGMAFFYAGKSLQNSPDLINLTFWVLTKKPQFAAAHNWTVNLGGESLDLGDARYASKPGESMEYLNFKISRDNLKKLAAGQNVRFKLGNADFSFTPAHLAMFKHLLAISEIN